ncbi:MAG: Fic family protein [Bacilli bacterium]|nr:Fic family protein [Bacilli bacterium]
MKNWEDYVLENGVLKNKLGITDHDKLHILEETIVTEKLALLIIDSYVGKFDSKHLRAIHKFLFEEIYDFAGSYREVDIFKKYTQFENPELISEHLDNLLNRVNEQAKLINHDNQFSVARFLGELYYELIMIHPFREGNGRAIREFIREFVTCKFPEYTLEYSKIDKNNFLLGITEINYYPLLLAYEFNNGLTKVNAKSK